MYSQQQSGFPGANPQQFQRPQFSQHQTGVPVANPHPQQYPQQQYQRPPHGQFPQQQANPQQFQRPHQGQYQLQAPQPMMGRPPSQQNGNPYSQPPPEVVPTHAMPPGFREAIQQHTSAPASNQTGVHVANPQQQQYQQPQYQQHSQQPPRVQHVPVTNGQYPNRQYPPQQQHAPQPQHPTQPQYPPQPQYQQHSQQPPRVQHVPVANHPSPQYQYSQQQTGVPVTNPQQQTGVPVANPQQQYQQQPQSQAQDQQQQQPHHPPATVISGGAPPPHVQRQQDQQQPPQQQQPQQHQNNGETVNTINTGLTPTSLTTSPVPDPNHPRIAIGIDLGTTFSCVAVCRNDRVEVISNEQGNRTTPSCVAFKGSERLVGDAARLQASSNPHNTVFDAKRLIGRRFEEASVQEDARHWPFKVQDKEGQPVIGIGDRQFAPEEISSMVLGKMKSIAEAHLGHPVTDAVVTVPAYFNDSQRQATKDAGRIAGLNILRIINEPTAAAIAYGLDRKDNSPAENHVLVFDLGGGTFDVSLLKIANGIFEVQSTGGNTRLGGEDFDNRLVDFLVREVQETQHQDVRQNARALRRLRTAAEQAKRALSSATQTTLHVDSLLEGADFTYELSRARFEQLNADLFDSCLETVRSVLIDAQLRREQVNDVVFVGGSTRVPRIQEIVQSYFQGKEPCRSINPDEAVAYGAAVQAAIIAGHAGDAAQKVLLVDVSPLSLGVETAGGVMNVMIPRNTTIPHLKTEMFSTYRDNQECVLVSIFEGERGMTQDNHRLGNFELQKIPAAKRGVPKIEVTFEIDVNGILHVSATDQTTGNANWVSIQNDTGRLSAERIEAMIQEAAAHESADRVQREQIEAKNVLENFLFQLRETMITQEVIEKVPAQSRNDIDRLVSDTIQWINTGGGTLVTKEQCEEQRKKIEEIVSPILGRLYQQTGEMPSDQGIEGGTALTGIQGGGTAPSFAGNNLGQPLTHVGPPYNQPSADQHPPSGPHPPPPMQTRQQTGVPVANPHQQQYNQTGVPVANPHQQYLGHQYQQGSPQYPQQQYPRGPPQYQPQQQTCVPQQQYQQQHYHGGPPQYPPQQQFQQQTGGVPMSNHHHNSHPNRLPQAQAQAQAPQYTNQGGASYPQQAAHQRQPSQLTRAPQTLHHPQPRYAQPQVPFPLNQPPRQRQEQHQHQQPVHPHSHQAEPISRPPARPSEVDQWQQKVQQQPRFPAPVRGMEQTLTITKRVQLDGSVLITEERKVSPVRTSAVRSPPTVSSQQHGGPIASFQGGQPAQQQQQAPKRRIIDTSRIPDIAQRPPFVSVLPGSSTLVNGDVVAYLEEGDNNTDNHNHNARVAHPNQLIETPRVQVIETVKKHNENNE